MKNSRTYIYSAFNNVRWHQTPRSIVKNSDFLVLLKIKFNKIMCSSNTDELTTPSSKMLSYFTTFGNLFSITVH